LRSKGMAGPYDDCIGSMFGLGKSQS
jgi:hypothetical protein